MLLVEELDQKLYGGTIDALHTHRRNEYDSILRATDDILVIDSCNVIVAAEESIVRTKSPGDGMQAPGRIN